MSQGVSINLPEIINKEAPVIPRHLLVEKKKISTDKTGKKKEEKNTPRFYNGPIYKAKDFDFY